MNLVEATKSNFKVFSKYIFPDIKLSKHHLQMMEKLQEIFEKKNNRLCIVCPPQRGKSTVTSVLFPAFILANNPDAKIIVASYAQELSFRFTRECRQFIESERYQSIVPHAKLAKDLNRKDNFNFEGAKGYYKSTSIGGSFTGFSADYIIVDDAFANFNQASSEKYRQDIYDWFTSVVLTRLSPNGVVIVCNTRWVKEDLIGQLLTKQPHLWDLLHIKAIEDDNSVCWSERYTLEDYEKIRNELGTAQFNALYQGDPSELSDIQFDTSTMQYTEMTMFPDMQYVRSWDIAVTNKSTSDYSACALLGIDKNNNVYIKNIQRFKIDYNNLISKIEEIAYIDGQDTWICIEGIGVGQAAFQEIKRRLSGFIVKDVETNKRHNKVQKALPFISRVEIGKVWLLKNAPWISMFLDECENFPGGGKHDDMVDAVSNGINLMAKRANSYEEEYTYEPGTWEYYQALTEATRNPYIFYRKRQKRI